MIKKIIFFLILFNASFAFANRLISVDPNDVLTISIGKRSYACTIINRRPVFGKAVSETLIRPFSTKLKKVRKRFRRSPDNNRLENRFKRLRKKNRKGKRTCKRAHNGGGGSNPPSDGDGDRNFDTNGNVTSAGRILFQIPNSVPSANVDRGLDVYQNNCAGCHMEARNLTFPVYRESIKRSPMLYFEDDIPDQELSDLTAYLNRFRLTQ